MSDDNKLTLGDKEFNLTPLPFGVLKKIEPHLELLQGLSSMTRLPNVAEMQAIEEVVLQCLKRYDSALSIEWLDEHLTVGNVGDVMLKIFATSGVKVSAEKEKAVP